MKAAGLVLLSHQDALMRAMDVVANNVANSTTTGFKRQENLFETYLSKPDPKHTYQFAVDRGTLRDVAQGPMVTTGNPLDVAIQGEGYFPIESKGGVLYTRNGSFQLNVDGVIVTAAGDPVLGDGDQPITIPPDATDLNISTDGVVTGRTAGTSVQFGKLRVVKFADEQELKSVGSNLYSTKQVGEPDTESRLAQGLLEQSNVQSVAEITNMIKIMRSYEMSVHLMDMDNQRQSSAINRLGKVSA